MLVGYARVSTGEQNLDLQTDALTQAGCAKIFTDQMSGAKAERPGLQEAFSFVRTGDTLIVWRLDRLGRSLKDQANCHVFRVPCLPVTQQNTQHAARNMSGLAAARARGRLGGRPRRMMPEQVKMASSLMQDPDVAVKVICQTLNVSRSTLYRYVGPASEPRQPNGDHGNALTGPKSG